MVQIEEKDLLPIPKLLQKIYIYIPQRQLFFLKSNESANTESIPTKSQHKT